MAASVNAAKGLLLIPLNLWGTWIKFCWWVWITFCGPSVPYLFHSCSIPVPYLFHTCSTLRYAQCLFHTCSIPRYMGVWIRARGGG